MTNILLFKISLVCSAIHVIGIVWLNPNLLYTILICACLVTSILNHLITNNIIKWIDRCLMLVGVTVNIYLSQTIYTITPAMLYVFAKMTNSYALHCIAHLLLTSINICIMKFV